MLKTTKKNGSDKEPISAAIYRKVFCTEFNLSFFKPKKDQCSVCSTYNMLLGEER